MNAEACGEGGAMPGAGAGPGAAALPWWRRPVAPGFFTCLWVLWVVAVGALMKEDKDLLWYGEVMAAVVFLPLLTAYGGWRLWSVAARRYGRWAWAWRVVMMGPVVVIGPPLLFAGLLFIPLVMMSALVLLAALGCLRLVSGPRAPAMPASSADSATQWEPLVEAASPAQAAKNAMNSEG